MGRHVYSHPAAKRLARGEAGRKTRNERREREKMQEEESGNSEHAFQHVVVAELEQGMAGLIGRQTGVVGGHGAAEELGGLAALEREPDPDPAAVVRGAGGVALLDELDRTRLLEHLAVLLHLLGVAEVVEIPRTVHTHTQR
ncbi:hypothetical protein PTTG_05892 [Puccinia triticina 1-1 BBBD Race 1]|uniref:Uncharacterized protein n=1 Tax=Puccinia triticina (isolate 1-1 / race 1 (BBBD)) TaxID=630390 RepID=A0A180GX06_PUCT1|nr:hypothetical protein PTTG_05892 [Puccinia triticina 1-1 BBBD Race 1]